MMVMTEFYMIFVSHNIHFYLENMSLMGKHMAKYNSSAKVEEQTFQTHLGVKKCITLIM